MASLRLAAFVVLISLGLAAAGSAATIHIGLVPAQAGEYADAMRAGAQQAAKELATPSAPAASTAPAASAVDGAPVPAQTPAAPATPPADLATVDFFLPATSDVAGQGQALLKAAASGCVGVILSPVGAGRSPAFLARVEEAFRSGATGIIIDAPVSSPYIAGLVGTGFFASGQEAGAFLGKRIGGDGGVLIVGDPKSSVGVSQFEKGFIDGLRFYPNAMAVMSGDLAQVIPAVQPSEVAGILKKLGGKVSAVCVADPEVWPEVSKILRDNPPAAGNKLAVMVYGNRKATIEALRGGEIDSVVADCPYLIGYFGFKSAWAAVHNKPVAAQKNVATKIVTSDKLNDPKIADFLNPAASGTGFRDEKPSRPMLIDQQGDQ